MTALSNNSSVDIQYLQLVNKILAKSDQGPAKDRTGAGRQRIFNHQMTFDLREEFPLLSLKKTHFASIVKELAWFCQGSTVISQLGCSIWNEWAFDEEDNPDVQHGSIGPMYGYQWRHKYGLGPFSGITKEDQLDNILQLARQDPTSSRLIVNSWDPNLIPRPGLSVKENLAAGYMALAPCHFAFQFFCEEVNGEMFMDMKAHCRSQDVFLGTPFNIASYALLLLISAQYLGYTARHFIADMGDCHIYGNHFDKVDEFLLQSRTFLQERSIKKHDGDYKPVKMVLPKGVTPFNMHTNDFVNKIIDGLQNYNPAPHIKFARN